MAEYIEREYVKSKKIYSEERHEYVVPVAEIDWIPAADVAPVKHGKWLNFYNDFSTAECSECAECFEVSPDKESEKEFFEAFKEFYNYCPNCGAKMDGGDEAP